MFDTKPLNEEEFVEMVNLLKRYSDNHLDQFDNWKLISKKGDVFISLSLKASGPESSYDELE
ncbi:hypothetical protein ISG33_14585 [Glaciecola sp. MH2013]|uniref:hypothetical protein n=1 Tax=Glaciecola sp. MH2013 TaxID=2785524 RepID=UPI0018A036FA|nr:hypothetical protein [Glaciecola sp. MH2013]MBF7074630.1 hypothetical protein [Glaciecola sp. MH2013]